MLQPKKLFLLYCILSKIIYCFGSGENRTMTFKPSDTRFFSITRSRTFADKTLMIRLVIDSSWLHPYFLITAPTGFGKSTLIDMFKEFLELSYDDTDLRVVTANETAKYLNFVNSSPPLNIVLQKRQLVEEHIGTYPVIYLNFSSESLRLEDSKKQSTSELIFLKLIANKLHASLSRYQSVVNETADGRAMMEKLESGTAGSEDLRTYLFDFAITLTKKFGKLPVLLIDEIDHPVQTAIRSSIDATSYIRIIDAMLCEILKESSERSKIISYAIITGISNMILTGESSLQGTLLLNPFLGPHLFTIYCGFTEDEMSIIFKRYNDVTVDEIESVKKFYNGYTDLVGTEIYSMFAINEYFAYRTELRDQKQDIKNALMPYWADLGQVNHCIARCLIRPNIRSALETLIENDRFRIRIHTHVLYEEIVQFQSLLRDSQETSTVYVDRVHFHFKYLLEHGILSYDNREGYVTIPNAIIKLALNTRIKQFMKQQLGICMDNCPHVTNAMLPIMKENHTTEKEALELRIRLRHLFFGEDNITIEHPLRPTEADFHFAFFKALSPTLDVFKPIMKATDKGFEKSNESDLCIRNRTSSILLSVEMKYNAPLEKSIQQLEHHKPISVPGEESLEEFVNLKRILINVILTKIEKDVTVVVLPTLKRAKNRTYVKFDEYPVGCDKILTLNTRI